MDTFVKKLRGASSNQNLPIYENAILKKWIKKTTTNQIVDLSSKMSGIQLNNYEVSIDFMIPSDSLYLDEGIIILGAARSNQSVILVDNNRVKVAFSGNYVFEQEVSLDTLHTITLNTNTNKITLDGVEHFVTYDTHSTSPIKEYKLFSTSMKGCGVYLSEVKFKNAASDNYEFILVPAIVNEISCYKNTIANSDYIYANTGELIAFNL